MALSKRDRAYSDYWKVRGEVLPALREHMHRPAPGEIVMAVDGLCLSFGGIMAVRDFHCQVKAGHIHSLIGPNGAGKTSVVNCISGVYRPDRGQVRLRGEAITRLPPHRIAARGVSRTFQRLALFDHLTVLDNILVAREHVLRAGMVEHGLGLGRAAREELAGMLPAEQILEFLHLKHVRDLFAGELSYGVQKRVEIGRALALEPTLLLLDEPVAGMNRDEKEDVVRCILDVRSELGVTCLLVEHEMDVVMSISDRITVMNFGEVIAEGSPAEVAADPKVIEAYLGQG